MNENGVHTIGFIKSEGSVHMVSFYPLHPAALEASSMPHHRNQ